jgi:adenylate kinase family enzyme
MKILTPQDLKHSASSPDHSVWIVEQLLRTNRQRISLLCGSPHAGKSTVARQLAVAVSQGNPFLGRETMKSKVAYWQSEETTEDAAEDFTKSGMTQDDPIVILHPSPGDNHLKELDKVLTDDSDIKVVIIETLDDFLQMDDLSDNPAARRAFERFDKEVVNKHKERVSFVAIHHFKKSDDQRGSSLTKILGATVIAGKTDCKIYLRQVGDADGRRIVSAQTRKGVPIEPTYLTFDEATQSSTLGQTLADERADAKKFSLSLTHSELRNRCIEIIATNPGLTQRVVCEKIGGKTKSANDMLRALIDDGVIVPQLGGATKTANLLYIKGKVPVEAPSIPWNLMPVCKGCRINKVAGAGFNAEWGADFCSTVCCGKEVSCVN